MNEAEFRTILEIKSNEIARLQNALDETIKEKREFRQQLADEQAKVREWNNVANSVDDYLRRIEETRWGWDGDCGVTYLANQGREIIEAAMKGKQG